MSPAHRQVFTRDELEKIRSILREVRTSDRDRQKGLRTQLRRMGFYITDYSSDQVGFTASDIDRLLARGTIQVSSVDPSPTRTEGDRSSPAPQRLARTTVDRGHRITSHWMGQEIETLEDLLRPRLRAVIVGINPAPTSVAAGHYYQGRLGQNLYRRLEKAGVIQFGGQGWEDDQAFEQGIGFTDVVKRPSSRADEVTQAELDHGQPLLLEKIRNSKPGLLIFSFKGSAETLFGPFEGNGLVPGLALDGIPAFVMPGPYAARDVVAGRLRELGQVFKSR